MKKASSSPPKDKKKKKLRTACLGEYGFKSIVISRSKEQTCCAPDSYVEDNVNAEFVAPATYVSPEEIMLGNVDLEIHHEETAVSASNENNELTVYEEEEVDPYFHCDADLEDASVAESIDDFYVNS